MTASFYFHDYETWGADPKKDRPAQFAGLRTDLDFNPIAELNMWYCQLAPDYLPHPEAALITGITPQVCQQKGDIEVEFMRKILRQFSEPETCVLGYNNIRFDDEVTRYSLYRNYFDPYAREWQHGNSRWDLIDVVRACYALRPEGINWPLKEDGSPSFRLEDLTKANGISHQNAHDASADVYATLEMAKLIKLKQPRLFQYLYEQRQKHKLSALIDVAGLTPLVHVSSKFPALQGCCSWIVPLAFHPTNKNAVICYNLAQNPRLLLEKSVAELSELLYKKTTDLAEGEARPGLKLVHLNKCPVLAPAKTLTQERAAELGIDRQQCLEHLEFIKANRQIQQIATAIYQQEQEFVAEKNPDYALYQGFISDYDRQLMTQIHQLTPEQLATFSPCFQDDRLNQLYFRFRARNYPQTLTHDELKKWRLYCQDKLQHGVDNPSLRADEFMVALENCVEAIGTDERKMAILKALYKFVAEN